MAVELNGFDLPDENASKENEDKSKLLKSLEKQEILERCGWKVARINSREWHYSKKACINKLKEMLIQISTTH